MECDDRTGVGRKANRGAEAVSCSTPSTAAQRATLLAVIEFDAAVVQQPDYGRHASLSVSTRHLLDAAGMHHTSWLRMRVDGSDPVFVRRGKLAITLPAWKFSAPERRVHLAIEPGESYRAIASQETRFDWLSLLPNDSSWFPTQTGENLTVWYRREALTLRRLPPEDLTYWLLGFYQADGAKRSVLEWSTVSSNPLVLSAIRTALTTGWGVPAERMYAQILHAPDDDPVAARAYFANVGVRVVSTRVRTQHKKWKSAGGRGCVLHVESSIVLYRLTMAALAQLFSDGFPSAAAARAFALGWIEGDGGVGGKKVTVMKLHGSRDEVRLVLDAFHQGFGWTAKGGEHDDARFVGARSLQAHEACALARAGGFAYSMNRARLLYALEARSRTVREIYSRVGTQPFERIDGVKHIVLLALIQPGLLAYWNGLFKLTAAAVALCETFPALLPEIEALRRFSPPERLGVTGVKCDPYPKELLVFNSQRVV